jgi:hypothetical protein
MKKYLDSNHFMEVIMFPFLKRFALLTLSLSCVSISANGAEYHNPDLGIAFTYPDSIKRDSANISTAPLKIPFTAGTPPMSVSVLLKDTGSIGTLDDFITREHAEQKSGGYFGQVEEHKHQLASGQHGIELIRQTKYGTIYYFVFPTPKTGKIMALHLMTSEIGDPTGEALKAYNQMKGSLHVANK